MTTYDNTNRGILWENKEDWKIIHDGKLNIDGEERRIIGVKRKNRDGEPIEEIFTKIGTLKGREKRGDKSPDATGVVENLVSKNPMQISAWKKTSNDQARVELAVRDLTDPTGSNNTDVGQTIGSNNTAVGNGGIQSEEKLDDEIPF